MPLLDKHIAEFREIVDAIYGTYLDACDGFAHVRAHAAETEQEGLRRYEEIKTKHAELSHLGFGGTDVSYPRWIPAGSVSRYRHLHQVSTDVLRRRNEEGGTNFQFIGNVCAVTLFQYWDEHYRALFAQDLGVERSDLQVPLFGDLRRYRQAIIHNRAIATGEVEECSILGWFKRGEPISLRRNMFEEIIDGVCAVLEVLERTPAQFVQHA